DYGPETGNGVRKLFNAAAVIRDGRRLDTIHKTLLPDYDVFWENRYFSAGENLHTTVIDGVTEGIFICEDLWDEAYQTRIAQQLVHMGATRLYNLSASPYHIGK